MTEVTSSPIAMGSSENQKAYAMLLTKLWTNRSSWNAAR
jgi:hypothetical protein